MVVKVALLLQLFLHDEAIQEANKDAYYAPLDNFADRYTHMRPPRGTQVWIGVTDPDDKEISPFTSFGGQIGFFYDEPGGPRHEAAGYVSTFALGRLVFHVFGRHVFWPKGSETRWDSPPIVLSEDDQLGLIQIWKPQTGFFQWPPRYRATLDGLRQIAGTPPAFIPPAREPIRGMPAPDPEPDAPTVMREPPPEPPVSRP